jgi:heat shock protein HslJ
VKYLLTLLSALLVSTQAVTAQTTIRMTVHETPQSCRRMMEMTCLQVQKNGAHEWELFYDRIKGFDYEPGYRYEIVVIQTERPEPVPQDLSKYLYTLDKVVSKTPMPAPAPISGWKVVMMNGKGVNELIWLTSDEQLTQVSGNSGCNRFSLPVSLSKNGKKLKTGSVTATEMACSEDAMAVENEFFKTIANKELRLIKRDGNWIWKKGSKEVLVLEATTIPVNEERTEQVRTPWDYFNGKHLNVIQLNGKQVPGSKAHVVFDSQNGRFSGSNGCNQVSGAFESNDGKVLFGKVMSTKMACTDEAVQQTEREMMAIFSQEGLAVDFAEQVVNIYDASGKLVMMLAVGK